MEVLIPDFKGSADDLERVMTAGPAVLNHNTETVLRLQREVRTAANYGRSLTLLARAKWLRPQGVVKSGLIAGMGETREEILGALADLRAVGADVGHHRPVSAAHPPPPAGAPLRPSRRVRRIRGLRAGAWAWPMWSRARWCVPPTTPKIP